MPSLNSLNEKSDALTVNEFILILNFLINIIIPLRAVINEATNSEIIRVFKSFWKERPIRHKMKNNT